MFQYDPLVRLLVSLGLLVVLLWLVSFLPESIKIKAGIGVVGFVALLNIRIIIGWIKDAIG